MNVEDLIPLTKRLEKVNEAIIEFTELFERIHQQPYTEITLNVSFPKDEDSSKNNVMDAMETMYGVWGMGGGMRNKREIFDINFEDDFAMSVIADIIRTLGKERDYIMDKINQFKEN